MRNKKPRVVIIGAGIAGITAADTLIRSGITNVTVLEAKIRTGGRIWSINVDSEHVSNTVAELGANWIHGVDRNPIYTIADENHLLELRHNGHGLRHKKIHATETGERIQKTIVDEVDWDYGMLMQKCEEFFNLNLQTPVENDSVGAYMLREYEKKIEKFSEPDEKRCRKLLFNQRLCRETVLSGCDSMFDVSLKEIGSYEELPGIDYTLPHGFESVLNVLKQNIPEGQIVLSCPVKCIKWNQGITPKYANCNAIAKCTVAKKSCGKVFTIGYDSDEDTEDDEPHDFTSSESVYTYNSDPDLAFEHEDSESDGDLDEHDLPVCVECENGQSYYADHVIVTTSLGFLKQHSQSFFCPTLPKQKLQAIDSLAFGSVGKVIIQFDEKIVDRHVQKIDLIWENWSNLDNTNENLRRSWFRKIESFEVIAENVFVGWVSGKECKYMETLTDEQVGADCVAILETFLGRHDIPKPKNVIRTKWTSDPYVLGAYTYIPVGSTVADIENLASPLMGSSQEPQILFAGEATHRSYYSTTHGALLTGKREAERILSHYHR